LPFFPAAAADFTGRDLARLAALTPRGAAVFDFFTA
jgi:hypothetical protein